MRNISIQEHITHLLLVDMETETQIRKLVGNCRAFAESLREVFHGAPLSLISRVYNVVLAISESNKRLAHIVTDIEVEMKSAGLSFYVDSIREEDMFLVKGKVGLLFCSAGWNIASALLLNDVPIPLTAVERIVDIANRLSHSGEKLALRKAGWFGVDYHIGLLAPYGSVGYLLKGFLSRFPLNHSVHDILRVMKSNCRAGELLVTRF